MARRAGVSEATVSRVLNGKPGASDATRATVLKALDATGYGLPRRGLPHRPRLVGLVLPELQNPVFPALAEVVTGALAQQNIMPVLWTPTVAELPAPGYVDPLLEYEISGVIFAGGMYSQADASRDHYRRLREKKLPVVVVNPTVGGLEFPRVATDDVAAVQQAATHLYQLGHRRIGLVLGPEQHVPSDRKAEAFQTFTTRTGDLAATRVERVGFGLDGGRVGGGRLIERGITGVICGSDILALGVIRAARRAGLRVPEDLSVIGYDDSAFLASTDPPLTTVRQPIDAIGRTVVALLVDQINGVVVPPDELLFEPGLVVRASTAPPGRGSAH